MKRILSLIPFRILFPVLFFSFTFVSVGVMIQTQVESITTNLIQDRKSLVAQNMSLTRSYLEERQAASEPVEEGFLRLLNADPQIRLLVVLDQSNYVMHSPSPGLQGKNMEEALKVPALNKAERDAVAAFLSERKIRSDGPVLEYLEKTEDIIALYPFRMETGEDSNQGIIVQLYSLENLIERRRAAVTGNILTTNLLIAGVLAALALGYYLFLMRRLQNLLDTTTAFGQGNLDSRASVDGKDEIAHLSTTFNMMADRIRSLAYRDAVTGIPNRLAFETSANRILQFTKTRAALLYLDLDGFKDINDSLGHSTGDTMLDEVANRLEQVVRSHAGEESLLARIGGDEFAILVPGQNDKRNIEKLCESLLQEVSRDYLVLGNVLHVTASIGLALFPENGKNFEELLKNADAAMYSGKRSGKNTYIFFDQEIQQRNNRRVQLSSALRKALDREELRIHFQPIVDLRTGLITHGEALLRWTSPEFGVVTPTEFIPILEESGYIRDVGQWVVHQSCLAAARWRTSGYSNTGVSVNVAVQQLSQKDFARQVENVLAETGLDPSGLILEITESELMRRPATTLRILETLDQMGVELAVDDFGTGYSSLNYLKYFPVHFLKLDGTFIKSLDTDEDNASISRAVVELAHALKLRMIAEGVESRSIAEFLHQESCDMVQGFFTGAAMPEEDFLRALSNQGPLFTDAPVS